MYVCMYVCVCVCACVYVYVCVGRAYAERVIVLFFCLAHRVSFSSRVPGLSLTKSNQRTTDTRNRILSSRSMRRSPITKYRYSFYQMA